MGIIAGTVFFEAILRRAFMSKDNFLEISYAKIGTVSLAEFEQAIWEDIKALHDEFGISFVNGSKLVVKATNEFGDPVVIKRLSTGAKVRQLDTHHYHPACLDYHL
jgi:hypothetical protein